jgi:hypothetical protein
MVLLKLYIKKLTKFLLLFCCITPAFAGVIPMFSPQYVTSKNGYYIRENLLLASDPFSISSIFNDLKKDFHPRNGRNVIYANERFDAGYIDKSLNYFGYVYREEIFFDTNKDIAEFIYLTQNKKDLTEGKTYSGALALKAYKMQGISYSRKFEIINKENYTVNLGFGVESLFSKEMQDGRLTGSAVANSNNDYTYTATANYNYTHNYLYDLDVDKYAYAYGYSSHLSLYVKSENMSFLFLANDLVGYLYWRHLPHSDVYLNSDNKKYDSNGYARFNPTVSGWEGYVKYKQKLMQKFRVESKYKTSNNNTYTIGSDYMERIYLPYIDVNHPVSKNLSLSCGYETRFSSVAIGMQYKNIHFSIRSDSLTKPSTLATEISVRF